MGDLRKRFRIEAERLRRNNPHIIYQSLLFVGEMPLIYRSLCKENCERTFTHRRSVADTEARRG